MDAQNISPDHYAILIGIDAYPENPLKGCVQDVRRMKEYLESAIDNVHIQTLTATEDFGKQRSTLPGDPMSRPTYENVISALQRVQSQAHPGDYIYIHFSGHGTHGEPYAEYSDNSTGDLALVLLDDKKEGGVNPLRGPILAFLLNALVRKGLVVTLVLDCCFSSTAYRRDDIRFLLCKPEQFSTELEKRSELATSTSDNRDISMRLNWLIDPDGYTIIAACGPDEEAREIKTPDDTKQGALSYFLRRTLDEPGGYGRHHRDIYKYLRALFKGSTVEQSPVLFGNANQGFFGPVTVQSDKNVIPIVRKQNRNLQLQAGEAHGVCSGDQFILFPFAPANPSLPSMDNSILTSITRAGALTSDLESVDTELIIQTGWLAKSLTQAALQRYPIRLASNLPNLDKLLATLNNNLLNARILTDGNSACFHIILNSKNEYEILDQFDQRVLNVPTISSTRSDIYHISDIMEHLAKFKLVKELTNGAPNPSFQASFDVRLIGVSGDVYTPGSLLNVQEREVFHLEVENKGARTLYVHIFNLGPFLEVESIDKGIYEAVPARLDGSHFLGILDRKLKTEVPSEMREKYDWCEDTLKVFVTSHPTSFDLFELPTLGGLVERNGFSSDRRKDNTDRIDSSSEMEAWAVLNFTVYLDTIVATEIDIYQRPNPQAEPHFNCNSSFQQSDGAVCFNGGLSYVYTDVKRDSVISSFVATEILHEFCTFKLPARSKMLQRSISHHLEYGIEKWANGILERDEETELGRK
ncbi:hypothetical protein G7Y89_g1035 [Cudoniella acicularis]|uniref:Peptidase C14 caspase domain-containing protein n=1 Tax=Cudoniella acicularis TaxID=354080 RepID=A0A8H4RW15_9HELO|nr:hypothetical protein G7Y89_g1035 [Cudoniella acicularis]